MKKLFRDIKNNLQEIYLGLLLLGGLPLIGLIYGSWREAVAVLIVVQLVVAVLYVRQEQKRGSR